MLRGRGRIKEDFTGGRILSGMTSRKEISRLREKRRAEAKTSPGKRTLGSLEMAAKKPSFGKRHLKPEGGLFDDQASEVNTEP